MYAGEMRQRITVERCTSSLDAVGQPTLVWTTRVASLPAKVESVAGGETIRGRQVLATATTLFTVRYRSDVSVKDRVSYEGRTLGILRAGDPYGDRRELRIEAAEITA